jgi:hypothetical protein
VLGLRIYDYWLDCNILKGREAESHIAIETREFARKTWRLPIVDKSLRGDDE